MRRVKPQTIVHKCTKCRIRCYDGYDFCERCQSRFCKPNCNLQFAEGVCPVCIGQIIPNRAIVKYFEEHDPIYLNQIKNTGGKKSHYEIVQYLEQNNLHLLNQIKDDIERIRRNKYASNLHNLRYGYIVHNIKNVSADLLIDVDYRIQFTSCPTNDVRFDVMRIATSVERGIQVSFIEMKNNPQDIIIQVTKISKSDFDANKSNESYVDMPTYRQFRKYFTYEDLLKLSN